MLNLFNPWIILGFVLSTLCAFGGGYYKGSTDEAARQQLEIAELNTQARVKEAALISAVNITANELRKTNEKAKIATKQRDAAIDSGAFKLRVPVQTSCPISPTADTATSSGDSRGETRAELDPTFGKALFEIAEEGDRAITKLNACIALYNQALESQKGIK